ncbi:MAG: hypothetical protein E7400_01695, partial [Ruminococcaceae bacterium]|nr:hypothetical protein [Oscillospiraceae bacterium]
ALQMKNYMLLWDYQDAGFTHYCLLTGGENCDDCNSLEGQVFSISEARVGENFAPMHPNCNCHVGILDDAGQVAYIISEGKAEKKGEETNWFINWIRNMYNASYEAEMAKYKAVDAMQKNIQREFWRFGAQHLLREKWGYLTSAWMLEHSLQDNPSDIWRGNDSRIANLINNDTAYLSKLDAAIKSSTNGKIDQDLEGVNFKTGDLYYSIHKSTIHVDGYLQNNGKWIVHAKMSDIYDFTEIQSFMDDNGGWSTQAGIGTVANDAATVSQLLGAINPYKITVEFYTTR